MSKKRFTDTLIWDKKWFRNLSPKQKLLWFYIKDRCDHVGLLEVDLGLFSFQIGEEFSEDDLEAFGSRVIKTDSDKIFIKDFVKFQYGNLNAKNNVHRSCVKRLDDYNLLHHVTNKATHEHLKGLVKGWSRHKDKDKEKEKVKDKYEGKYTTKEIPF